MLASTTRRALPQLLRAAAKQGPFLGRQQAFFSTTQRAVATQLATRRMSLSSSSFAQGPQAAKALPSEVFQQAHGSAAELRAADILKAAGQMGEQASASAGALSTAQQVANRGLVFEFGVGWIISAYQNVFVGLLRNVFYTTRPLIILFAFGQLLKMVFFAMGAPMLLSFYSIWMFEVFYGVLQLFLSFIFVSNYYNNMAFRGRAKPAMKLFQRRGMQTLKQAARRLGLN